MKVSKLFFTTLRETPSDATIPSHVLLLRGGYIKQLSTGVYSILPLGLKVIRRIEKIIRDEMNAIDGQEVDLPLVHPSELWSESGRYEAIGQELLRFKDRTEHDMVLAMTHEEAMTDLSRYVLNSYKQLPFMLYQFKLKYRDETRPRAGLIRVKEFVMKDAYSFHQDHECLDKYYEKALEAYKSSFRKVGIEPVIVKSDTGIMGGKVAHEFMLESEHGEDYLILCDSCGYQANGEIAEFKKEEFPEELKEIEKVHTPGLKSIEEVSEFLKVPQHKTMKCVFFETEEQLFTVVIRGDLDVSETKLKNALKLNEVYPASEERIQQSGMVPGFASPIGSKDTTILLDTSAQNNNNLVAGANEMDYHILNCNTDRDFKADLIVDVAQAVTGNTCLECNAELRATRGIEIGNIFKLGTKFSESMGATFLDEEGKRKPAVMGCYGIGVGRLMASIVENSHDDWGIIWPKEVAPYQVLISTIVKGDRALEESEKLYKRLLEKGIDVLWDDRKERPGVKFKDADLWGIPLRIVVGGKSLDEDIVEFKLRSEKDKSLIPLSQIDEEIQKHI